MLDVQGTQLMLTGRGGAGTFGSCRDNPSGGAGMGASSLGEAENIPGCLLSPSIIICRRELENAQEQTGSC